MLQNTCIVQNKLLFISLAYHIILTIFDFAFIYLDLIHAVSFLIDGYNCAIQMPYRPFTLFTDSIIVAKCGKHPREAACGNGGERKLSRYCM